MFCNISRSLYIILLKGLLTFNGLTQDIEFSRIVNPDVSIPLPDSIDISLDEETGKILLNDEVTQGNENIEICMVIPTPLP